MNTFKFLLVCCILGIVLSTTCRDGSQCPGTTTCCLTPRGVGCCPYTNANCCGDGIHCCPYGYNCNSAGGCSAADGSHLTPFGKYADIFFPRENGFVDQ